MRQLKSRKLPNNTNCETRHDLSQYMTVFEYDALFPETNLRECDNIVWHIAVGRPIYPLTVYTDQHGVAVGVSKRSTILTRDYRCHDSLLYEATEFPTSRLIGQPPYAYRFPKAIYDGTNYMIGFMADGNHFTAESVEFDDEFEYAE